MKRIVLIPALVVIYLASIIFTFYYSRQSLIDSEREKSFKFDTLATRIVSASNYVMLGDEYRAEVFLSAFSTTAPLQLEIDSPNNPNQIITYNKGVCSYRSIPDSVGVYQLSGSLKVKVSFSGDTAAFPFRTEFAVARPSVNINPVGFSLKRGKENRFEISIPGVSLEKLNVLVSNAKINGEKGKYTIIPGKENKCIITVLSYINGEGKKMGQCEYPVVD